MECVHRFARELRPAVLDDLGLLPALRSCVNGFSERTGIRVRFQADGVSETLDPERKTVIYRIAQECLNNVAKHARASGVEVRLSNSGGVVRMLIKDDGKGFPAGSGSVSQGRKRLGLLGMRERVNLVSGRFDIESAPGAGTTVRIEIPVKPFPKVPDGTGSEAGRGRRARSTQKLKTRIES
jgi:signal transduction histidine kinase